MIPSSVAALVLIIVFSNIYKNAIDGKAMLSEPMNALYAMLSLGAIFDFIHIFMTA